MSKAEQVFEQPWWALVVEGIAAIAFGFAAMVWPGITIGVMALLLAIFVGVYGIFDIINGVRTVGKDAWSGILHLALGALEVGISVFLLNRVGSGLAIATLILLIVLGFAARGIVAIVLAFSSGVEGGAKWLTVVMGVLSIICAIIIARYPVPGALTWVWVIGLFALISGPFQIAMGITQKDAEKELAAKK